MRSLKHWKPTNSQRQTMMREIEAQTDIVKDELIYIVLYVLWKEFGFGEKRLHRFYIRFTERYKNLRAWIQGNRDDTVWLCQTKLKSNLGIDINVWEKELHR